MFKNSHLRLLMKLVGFERLAPVLDETPESSWIVPAQLSSEQLQDSLDLINKAEFNPPTFEDGKLAQDQLRRKTAPRRKAVFDDDEEGVDDDDDILFPAGGPTNWKAADDTLDKPKKIRRRRRRSDAEPLTNEQLEEKARARRERERAKAKRFKSELFVHASDDESDDGEKWAEFYVNEERIRQKQKAVALTASDQAAQQKLASAAEKRKAGILDSESDSDDDDDLVMTQDSAPNRPNDSAALSSDDEDQDTSEADSTPLSSTSHAGSPSRSKRRRVSKDPSSPGSPAKSSPNVGEDEVMEDADEDISASKPTQQRRSRARAGFIIDSSDEE